jgi:hypothetical protein
MPDCFVSKAFDAYWYKLTGNSLSDETDPSPPNTYTDYYRMSTGQLCLDLTQGCDVSLVIHLSSVWMRDWNHFSGLKVLSASGCASVAELIDNVGMDPVLATFARRSRRVSFRIDPLQLCFRPAVVYGFSTLAPLNTGIPMVRVVSFLDVSFGFVQEECGWQYWNLEEDEEDGFLCGVKMPNGWTRYVR